MKLNRYYQQFSHTFLAVIVLVIGHPAAAQIPQNIEVDGEPAKFWDYAVYIFVLAGIILAIFLIARLFKRPQK